MIVYTFIYHRTILKVKGKNCFKLRYLICTESVKNRLKSEIKHKT